MTKVIDRIVSSTNGTRAYVSAYLLNEAGIAAATGNAFTPAWSATPSTVGYASVFLGNVNQTTPVGTNDSNGTGTSTPNPIKTIPLSTGDGDMVIVGATCGKEGAGDVYTVNNGFTEGIEQVVNSTATCVTGHKSATGADETPSVTHNNSPNRQVIIGFVVQAAGAPAFSNCGEVQAAGFRLKSDLDGDCYVDYLDLDAMVYYWLNDDCDETNNYCGMTDFEPRDGVVDFFDFSDFAMQWLECNDPEDPECSPNW
jgi:hypothetical protein